MRALTVRQPWAWAIVHGGKDVENRSRNIAGGYRGPVAIHAGLTPDTAAQGYWPLGDIIPMHAWKLRGVFIGVLDLVEVHHGDCLTIETYREGHEQRVETCSSWAEQSMHHLVLANPRPLEHPIPAKGRLGLWTPPVEVAHQIQEATR